jgi:transposase
VAGGERQDREPRDVPPFFKSIGGRYKRVRKRCNGKPDAALYAHKRWCLQEFERLSEQGLIDLFYADETHVSSQGYVPYAWQFPGEDLHIPVSKGYKVNIFGLINRQSRCHWTSTTANINSAFVIDYLEQLSLEITKETVVVADNASVHRSKALRECMALWQTRGLFIVFLPPYSPHLNCAETLWRKLKKEWLRPEDYAHKESLFAAVERCMAAVGGELTINFSPFNVN